MNNLLGEGSKDGDSQPMNYDQFKAESSKYHWFSSLIDLAVSNISTYINPIMKERSNLFNTENNVKSWKANELKFYNDRIADSVKFS